MLKLVTDHTQQWLFMESKVSIRVMDGQISDGRKDKPTPNAKSGAGMDEEKIQLKMNWWEIIE
jgi:hypothetical protein